MIHIIFNMQPTSIGGYLNKKPALRINKNNNNLGWSEKDFKLISVFLYFLICTI